jgi:hypothetical protein
MRSGCDPSTDSGPPETRAAPDASASPNTTLKRVALAGAAAFVTANIWTGCPLLALWVGSQVVGQQVLSMAAVGVVIVVLAMLVTAMVMCLSRLNRTYDALTGRRLGDRRAPWLRSMGANTEGVTNQRVETSALERIVIVNVYIAVAAFMVWYIFFAGSPGL